MEYEKTTLVVIEHDGKFLLLRRAKDRIEGERWCFPGGHKDLGETLQECVVRETKEETDLDIELDEYDPFYIFEHEFGSPDHIHRCHCFKAKLNGDPKQVKINRESMDSGWFTLEEMKRIELTGYSKTTVEKLKEMQNTSN